MEDSFDARLNGEYKPPRAEKKGGKGWMITSIILFVLLVGAGTFAGIMLFSNNNNGDKMLASEKQVAEKDAKISELEITISEKDAEIATLKNGSVTPGQTEPKLQGGYIYMPSWGVKINMNGAKTVSYRYNATTEHLTLWALDPSINQTTLPKFVDPEENEAGLGDISFSKTKINTENVGSAPDLIYEIPNNGGYIYYYHLQQAYSNENGAKGDGELEMKSADYLGKKVFVKDSFSTL